MALDEITVGLLNGASTDEGRDVAVETFALLASVLKTLKSAIGRSCRDALEGGKFTAVDDGRRLCPAEKIGERLQTILVPRLAVAAARVQEIEDRMSTNQRFCGPFTHELGLIPR